MERVRGKGSGEGVRGRGQGEGVCKPPQRGAARGRVGASSASDLGASRRISAYLGCISPREISASSASSIVPPLAVRAATHAARGARVSKCSSSTYGKGPRSFAEMSTPSRPPAAAPPHRFPPAGPQPQQRVDLILLRGPLAARLQAAPRPRVCGKGFTPPPHERSVAVSPPPRASRPPASTPTARTRPPRARSMPRQFLDSS